MSGLDIAMVVRSFSVHGGLELYAHKVIEGLIARGLNVTVVCEENLSSLNHENLRVVLFPPAPARLPKWKRLRHQLDAATEALGSAGRFQLVHSQHFPVAAADVVTFHNHTVGRLSKVGLPWESYLNDFKRWLVPAYRLRDELDELLVRRARCLVFPAMVCRDDFYSSYAGVQGLQAKPWVVARPGADLAGEAAAVEPATLDSPASGNRRFTFLFVGRGYRKKGLDVLLRACSLLRRERDDFRLIIAGLAIKPVGRLELRLLGLEDSVTYLGFRKDMENVFAQAQAFVMPSRMEPFGMAPLQAMQRGLPAIVSAVSGVSEVLADRENALILRNHLDAAELAALMRELLTNPQLLARLSGEARKAAGKLTWSDTVEATLRAYAIALGMDAGAASAQGFNV